MIRGGLVTLFVRDVGAAVRFYVETLGMKLVERAGTGWAVIDAGDGFRIGLHEAAAKLDDQARAGSRAASPSVGLAVKVPIREAIAIYENRGVAFDVRNDGPTTLARFTDLDGNELCLFEDR